MEVELESEEPTEMGGDTSSSKDEGGQEVIAALVEHHKPAAASISGGWDAERHGDVPTSRKRAASSNVAVG